MYSNRPQGYIVFAIYSTVWIEGVLCFLAISQSFSMFQCKFEYVEFKKNHAGIPNLFTMPYIGGAKNICFIKKIHCNYSSGIVICKLSK